MAIFDDQVGSVSDAVLATRLSAAGLTVAKASSATPQALGVAAAGSGTSFSRDDHVHSSTVPKLTFTTATNGILAGSGASTGRTALGTTAGNALEFYLNATHTTGDMRGNYTNLTFSGVGGSGEALRAFGIVNGVTAATGGTVNGAHISLDFVGANAKISGAGNALRATFGISDAAATAVGGTCSTIQVDTFFDTAITVPNGFSFLRFTNSGVKVAANLFKLPNAINGAALLFSAHTDVAMTHSLRCVSEDGTVYYLMATTNATGRS
jgi:hypothetical protein